MAGSQHVSQYFASRYGEDHSRRAAALFWVQITLFLLLVATLALVLAVNRNARLILYVSLLAGLGTLLLFALGLNLKGRYRASAWMTVLLAVAGPWGAIGLDPTIIAGDFVPLVYLALSVQLCSMFLSDRATFALTALEIGALTALIAVSPMLRQFNWPSLLAFIVFASTLGIVSSFFNRKQMEQIERQRDRLRESEAKLTALSTRDSLTGLYNRRYMEETLDRELRRALRQDKPLCIIMADVDDFKAINDACGHARGDVVLQRVADLLGRGIRSSDVACRYGGDELVMILPECSGTEAVARAEQLRRQVEEADFSVLSPQMKGVTLSFGVAAAPEQGVEPGALLLAADRALYRAKQAGRNRVMGPGEIPAEA